MLIVIVFYNEENLYNVMWIWIKKINLEIEDKEMVVIGYFFKLNEDEVYMFYGDFKEYLKFGLQFYVEQFKKEFL